MVEGVDNIALGKEEGGGEEDTTITMATGVEEVYTVKVNAIYYSTDWTQTNTRAGPNSDKVQPVLVSSFKNLHTISVSRGPP